MDNPYDLPGISAFLDTASLGNHDFAAPNEYDDKVYSSREVRFLIKIAQMETEMTLRKEIRQDLMAELRSEIDQLRMEMDRKINHAVAPEPIADDVLRTNPLPTLNQISKLRAQYFDNRDKPKDERKGQAAIQIKLAAWIGKTATKHANGNQGYWLVPLHDPNSAEGRRRLGKETMMSIAEIDRISIKHAGCVRQDGAKGKVPDQVVVVRYDGTMALLLEGQWLEFGKAKPRAADAHHLAPLKSWYWPDSFRD